MHNTGEFNNVGHTASEVARDFGLITRQGSDQHNVVS